MHDSTARVNAALMSERARRRWPPPLLGSLFLTLACSEADPTGTDFSALLLTTSSLPTAEVAVDYNESFDASGGGRGVQLVNRLWLATTGAELERDDGHRVWSTYSRDRCLRLYGGGCERRRADR